MLSNIDIIQGFVLEYVKFDAAMTRESLHRSFNNHCDTIGYSELEESIQHFGYQVANSSVIYSGGVE